MTSKIPKAHIDKFEYIAEKLAACSRHTPEDVMEAMALDLKMTEDEADTLTMWLSIAAANEKAK